MIVKTLPLPIPISRRENEKKKGKRRKAEQLCRQYIHSNNTELINLFDYNLFNNTENMRSDYLEN